jgi:hypothetical protein
VGLKIRVFAEAAVVTGQVTFKAVRGGKDWSGPERFTDTFVRRDGQWQAVATRSSRVAKP